MPSAVENGNRRKGNCVEQWSGAAEPLISRINRRSPGENRVRRVVGFGEANWPGRRVKLNFTHKLTTLFGWFKRLCSGRYSEP